MLKEVDIDIWVAEQPFRYLGLSVGIRMTVIRLANQELAIISAIQPSDTLVSELSKLGVVKHIIAPNLYHHLFAANFKSIYPQATFWAAPGLTIKKPELLIDQTIRGDRGELLPGLDFMVFNGLRVLGLNGVDLLNECVFFHSASRTLILTDTAFHFDKSFPLLTQFAARLLGGYKQLSPSVLERLATTEKEQVRQSVEGILLWDFERVIMAHGSIIERDGKEKFKKGYESFLR
ncbi:DUF4336 domain-containing protein [Oxynema aestuarii]|jgi:hypothetical protein|uniref:DUF4336 domain-containing protein n=1 Tax=Oxynema aestuarii AP17 TaxID=2064643 RepID=A0A6H1TXX2_9CYAN|nr:DUF4336 domain-containing protein [Oxynema aestuarii]QIZ71434.1 DUF4336 domain-containing protein [Oxynema aestuarii AP17]